MLMHTGTWHVPAAPISFPLEANILYSITRSYHRSPGPFVERQQAQNSVIPYRTCQTARSELAVSLDLCWTSAVTAKAIIWFCTDNDQKTSLHTYGSRFITRYKRQAECEYWQFRKC